MFGFKRAVRHRIMPGLQGDRDQRYSRDNNSILFSIDSRSGAISIAPQIAFDHGHALNPIDPFSFNELDLMERGNSTSGYQTNGDIEFLCNGAWLFSFYTWFIK